VLPLITAMYIAQAVTSFTSSSGPAAESTGATFVIVFFAVRIARSWGLLGLRGGGVLDLLVTRSPGPGGAAGTGQEAAENDSG
jgi:hypothetical protein